MGWVLGWEAVGSKARWAVSMSVYGILWPRELALGMG